MKHRLIIFFVFCLLLFAGCNSQKYTEDDFNLYYDIALDYDGRYKIDGQIVNKSKRKDFDVVKIQFDLTAKDGRVLDAGTVVIKDVETDYSPKFSMDIHEFMKKNKLNLFNIKYLKPNLVQ